MTKYTAEKDNFVQIVNRQRARTVIQWVHGKGDKTTIVGSRKYKCLSLVRENINVGGQKYKSKPLNVGG